MNETAPPSLFFFTFHKCASVFVSRFVLQQARGFVHVDHAGRMALGEALPADPFLRRGHLYGPLRLSAQGVVLDRLIMPALEAARRDGCRICLMVRDPRDMLVSQYFHNRDGRALRPDHTGAPWKEGERAAAVELGIDRYVLEKADRFLAGCERAARLVAESPSTHVLRYEDMVDDWDAFLERLQSVFDLSAETIRNVAVESRPNAVERSGAHKRSGRTGDHRRKLTPETVDAITSRFTSFLETFGY